MLFAILGRVFDAQVNARIRRIVPSNRSGGAGKACFRSNRLLAFSLVEIMISLSLLTITAASAIWALNQTNNSAAANRIYTCAEIIAQNEIDAFLSAQPYNPQLGQIPAALVTGTSNTPIITPANPNGSVPIYTDPASGGSLSVASNKPNDSPAGFIRTVTDLGLNQTTNGVVTSLNCRSLIVTINYIFRGKTYNVTLATFRAPDS